MSLRFVIVLLRALAATAVGRLWRGPLRPSWSFRFELFARVLKLNAASLSRLSKEAQRRANEAMASAMPSRLSEGVRREAATLGGVEGEWFLPEWERGERVILYLHGGGFVAGSSHTHHDLCMRLAQAAGVRLFAPNYRLSPEHRFPAALDDAERALHGLGEAGIGPAEVVLAGDSAGGNLALALLLRLRDAGAALPVRALLLSPWVDVARRGGSMSAHRVCDWAEPEDFDDWQQSYLGDHPATDPLVSPLLADLTRLPPLLLEVGTAEMLLDQVRDLAEALRRAGGTLHYRELEDMVHDSYLLAASFPERQADIERLGAFVGAS